jgi:hypothetical protein
LINPGLLLLKEGEGEGCSIFSFSFLPFSISPYLSLFSLFASFSFLINFGRKLILIL